MLSKIRQGNGLLMALIAAISTIWLTVSGKLDWYVHPRYIVFNAIFAALLIAACLGVFWTNVRADRTKRGWRDYGTLGMSIFSFVVLLVLPPQLLSSVTASQRGVNTSTTVSTAVLEQTPDLFSDEGAFSRLDIKDWAGLLGQTRDAAFFTGKDLEIHGMVTADDYDPDNIFYVTRFVISCCAIDAQPIGVPVYAPNWNREFHENQWVKVKGEFIEWQYRSAKAPVIVNPTLIDAAQEPEEPYVF